MPGWAAFLDRDGTLIEEVGHLADPDDLRVLPGAAAGVKRLREAGAVVVIVTNQPVVARGLIDEAGVRRIHDKLEKILAADGASVDAIYYCPHHPEKSHPEANDPKYRRDCECRKPKPGMLIEAARRFGVDMARSFMIGDTTRDMLTARNAGCRAVLVRTGYGGKDELFNAKPDAVCADVAAAAEWIAGQAAQA